MDPDRFQHDYVNQTVLHPLGMAAVIVLGLSLLLVPRRYAVWPMIVMACFVAPAQRVVVFTLNFDLLRIMVLFGTVRIAAWGEWRGMRWNRIDVLLVLWTLSGAIIYILSYGTAEAVKYRLGTMYDAVGMYFLFRMLIREWSDARTTTIGFIVVAVPVAFAFMIEHATGRNVFAQLGGVPEITIVREGRLRCQGAFAHSILAGCFWAGVMPLMAAQWWCGGSARRWSAIGLVASIIIILLCASSTPVTAVGFGVAGAILFPMRRYLRYVRWGILALLLALHLVMGTPVWHLISRIDLAGGSTGWQRYHLINEAIRHFDDWWLLGTHSTQRWAEDLYDVTNQFILEGVRGGVLTLCLFVAMIGFSFQAVGRLCQSVEQDRPKLVLAWALGVALFIHCMNFMAVSYFGQIEMVWYLLLATIASLSVIPRARGDAAHDLRRRKRAAGKPSSQRIASTARPVASSNALTEGNAGQTGLNLTRSRLFSDASR
jgi:hypothetical protein